MTEASAALSRLGLLKSSLIDYPGRVSAVVFTAGCNFHCSFCHNPELVHPGLHPPTFIEREAVIAYLRKRSRVLDGVVITGGEPLYYEEIVGLVEEIRDIGLRVKIDTNGSYPERLALLAPDYVAIDLKCAPSRYPLLTDVYDPIEKIVRSIRFVLDNHIEHEFRTTVVPGLVDRDGFTEVLKLAKGCDRFVLNEFRPMRTLDPRLTRTVPYPAEVYREFVRLAHDSGLRCTLRGATSADLM